MFLILYVIFTLIIVGFFTLFERKILAFIQIRKGPSKVGLSGILQPMADAVKLFLKSLNSPLFSNLSLYSLSPFFFICLSLTFFFLKPFHFGLIFTHGMLILRFFYSLGVYSSLFTGWSSNSKYALIGSMRSVTQSLSYEVTLSLIFLFFCLIYSSSSVSLIIEKNFFMFNLFMNFLILLILFINFLIEASRAPFDLSECEFELVSGFNVEYGGVEFSFVFLGENLMLIFNSLILSIFLSNYEFFYLFWCVMVTMMVFTRGSYPRYRLDFMIELCWLLFIPFLVYMFIPLLMMM
uniref:NADH-ubiquinone oxidoreductase chain 1 n=1 Tax=Liposcelis sculptilimacula TaxID=1899352 RepID=A0A191ZS45_9NEOP|nr:NADH dehydrogenase subunit 1 [Liposcelis keleri]ANJ70940.1 NADH dehydrogenase subunit 1 [Liposcelis sculptilimacula]